MTAWAFVVVALVVTAVVAAVRPPFEGWSNELRAVLVVDLGVAATLGLIAGLMYRLLPSERKPRVMRLVRIGLLVAALLAMGAAIALAAVIPFDLPHWSRPLFAAVAGLDGSLIVMSLLFAQLPQSIRAKAKTKRGLGAILVVLAAAGAAVAGLLLPDLAGWVRWTLAAFAVTLFLAGRLWGQAAWPDAAVVSLAAVAIAAGIAGAVTEPQPAGDSPTVAFKLPADVVTVLSPIEKDGKVVLLVVQPATVADHAPISYKSTRYEGTVSNALSKGEPSGEVEVTVERGAKDAQAGAFSADLTAATIIYLMSADD